MDHLSIALLEAVARVKRDDWVHGSLADWHNRVAPILGQTTVPHNTLVDAIIWLAKKDLVEIQKWKGYTYAPFNFALVRDALYPTEFFYSGGFQLKLTHEGRQILDSAAPTPTPQHKIGFNPTA